MSKDNKMAVVCLVGAALLIMLNLETIFRPNPM